MPPDIAHRETAPAPRLLDQVRDTIRRRHYSYRTEEAYVHWIRRYILFHHKRHPRDMAAPEVTAFLNHLARDRDVAASTQNQALSALLFLYKDVLALPLPCLDDLERAQRPARLPTVLTAGEAERLLARLDGTKWLMASLLYGAGLRLRECLKLRVKDVDFEYRQVFVRDDVAGRARGGRRNTATQIENGPHIAARSVTQPGRRLHMAGLIVNTRESASKIKADRMNTIFGITK